MTEESENSEHEPSDETETDAPDAAVDDEPEILRGPSRLSDPGPSDTSSPLSSPWLSKRSLAPVVEVSRRERLRNIRGYLIFGGVVLVAILVVIIGKISADRAADAHMNERIDEIDQILDGATAEEFLSFGRMVNEPGSRAQQIRDQPGFMNVIAKADLAFVRIQPEGWWSAFAERCIVIEITPDGHTFRKPKEPCVQVKTPNSN